jgi:hypothetical protein
MDDIHQIQTDNSEISDKDRYVINTIFSNRKMEKKYHFKQVLIMTLLFSLLSLPSLDDYIETYTKLKNPYSKLAFKTILFFLLYFLIVNYVVKN